MLIEKVGPKRRHWGRGNPGSELPTVPSACTLLQVRRLPAAPYELRPGTGGQTHRVAEDSPAPHRRADMRWMSSGAQDTTATRSSSPSRRDRTDPLAGFYGSGPMASSMWRTASPKPDRRRLRSAALKWMEQYNVPAYDRRAGGGLVRLLCPGEPGWIPSSVCCSGGGPRSPIEAELAPPPSRAAEARGWRAWCWASTGREEQRHPGRPLPYPLGPGYLEDVLCGLSFRLSVPSFYQVNAPRQRCSTVAHWFRRPHGEAEPCWTSTAASRHHPSWSWPGGRCGSSAPGWFPGGGGCQGNAARNGIANAEFLCADAGEAARSLAEERREN